MNSADRSQEDARLLSRTLLGLATPRLIRRAIVIVIAALVWLFICSRILGFGAGMRYTALAPLGQQTVDLLIRINPYLWWVVVVLFTLAVFFGVRGWYERSIAAGRAQPVDLPTLRDLAHGLSDDGRMVLGWAWRDREDPITVGDLLLARDEMRHGRASKIYLAREQAEALRLPPLETAPAAPGVSAPAPAVRKAGAPAAPAEPPLGDLAPRSRSQDVFAPRPAAPAPKAEPAPAPTPASSPAKAEPVIGTTPAEPTLRAEPRVQPEAPRATTQRTEPRLGDIGPKR
ncbi:hypothetical protein [Orrella dioscoreae]|uniref:hypothetical protein n=1 Tax=Orrella dioscoreae TaxID=1851544 RepID=UPI000836F4CF|nr:hypothetical protein [Orrella dioscoreae]